eukprot:CAMPEP_0197186354 /NCGR_PEP_ID=MMETSP1423-20130617/13761_1 /TAXON_ID=476441 /ORGANISM="Pseudo-nitzschia heimii, Strain UNC1101" /LENGTH=480 /DNA_ID=CAMNT_0042637641 /DNA_START=91 /DNA_END=1530 /DNA_ORIENTATION=+
MTEVGVSLALRRHRRLIGYPDGKTSNKRKRSRSSSPQHSTVNNDSVKGTNCRSGIQSKKNVEARVNGEALPSYSSWRILFEGAALYIFCMILPTLLRATGRLCQRVWREGMFVFYKLMGYGCLQPWLREWQTCQRYLPGTDRNASTNSSFLAPDAGISDLAIVIFLSLSMAVIRIVLVHFLVPNYKQPKRLEALVRCKSMHLLSSSYSGSVTPTKVMRIKSLESPSSHTLTGFRLPNLNRDNDPHGEDDESCDHHIINTNNIDIKPRFTSPTSLDFDDTIYIPSDDISDEMKIYEQTGNHLFPSTSEVNRSPKDNLNKENVEDDENQIPAPAVSSGLLTNTSAQNLQALLEQAAPTASSLALQRDNHQNSTKTETTERIYAAPKYATAVFRLIYCFVSCLIGFFYFWAADFWPPALGGTGSTKNCWDLSSVGVTLMKTDFDIVDSDFDSYNPVLRRYYLIQASYHFHSAAFHILTSVLLW